MVYEICFKTPWPGDALCVNRSWTSGKTDDALCGHFWLSNPRLLLLLRLSFHWTLSVYHGAVMRIVVSILGLVVLIPFGSQCSAVDVELLVRSPDATPLANTAIIITPPKSRGLGETKVETIMTKTNAQGIAQFQLPAGVYDHFAVDVADVGYGDIGITEFVSGKTARPHLPPLVPYGTIEGLIPDDVRRPDIMVGSYLTYSDDRISVHPDAEGHFKFPNARTGTWFLGAAVDKTRYAESESTFSLAPGQVVRDLHLKSLPPERTKPPTGLQRAARCRKGPDNCLGAGESVR